MFMCISKKKNLSQVTVVTKALLKEKEVFQKEWRRYYQTIFSTPKDNSFGRFCTLKQK